MDRVGLAILEQELKADATVQRYLRADRAGQAAQEWARLGIVRSMALPQPSPG